MQVCKKMFQRTLGWHSDSVIKGHQRWCQKTPERVTVVDREDQRGQNGTHRALDHEPIRQHILSYHPAVSHNRNVMKRYLEPELTVKSLCLGRGWRGRGRVWLVGATASMLENIIY